MSEGGFSPDKYRELKTNPEAKDYRNAMAAALKAARVYDGTESRYTELMSFLEGLEEVIQTSPSLKPDIPTGLEVEAALRFAPLEPRLINDVLGIAEESRKKSLHRSIENPERPDNALLVHRIETVILPPDKDFRFEKGLYPEPIEPAEFEQRLDAFISLLAKHGVYADDLVITVGPTPQGSFRRVGYTHVEIPRLGRVVLLCDQIGEATFVIRGYIDPTTPWTKEELRIAMPADCRQVIKHSQRVWERMLTEYIFTEQAWDEEQETFPRSKAKLDVRERDSFRQQLLLAYTPEQFFVEPFGKMMKRKFNERGWKAIFALFGIDQKIVTPEARLALARVLWGDAHPEVAARIERGFPTAPEGWRSVLEISEDIGRDRHHVKTVLEKLADNQEGWVGQYHHPVYNQLRTYYAPDAIKALKEFFATRKTAEPGWVANHPLSRALKVSQASVEDYVAQFRTTNPEWFDVYDDVGGHARGHYHPDLVTKVTEHFKNFQKENEVPEGWRSRASMVKKWGVDPRTVISTAAKFSREGEVRELIGAKSHSLEEYYHPDLAGKLDKHFEARKPRPEGWMTLRELALTFGVQPDAISRRVTPLLAEHPEWIKLFLIPGGAARDHLAPELIEILTDRMIK